MENSYIIFQADGLRFLILSQYVEMIGPAGKVEEENIPVYDFCRISGMDTCSAGNRYVLVLRAGEERFGITAERVEDIMNIDDSSMISLEGVDIGENNQYLSDVYCHEDMKPSLIYNLDVARLYEKAAVQEPEYLL